jgi:hypothetical protein
MCNELFLAILYFLTIFLVNYFIFKLIKNYFIRIRFLMKVKKILSFFTQQTSNLTILNYLLFKSHFHNQNIVSYFPKFSTYQDNLLIGNIYSYFSGFFELNLFQNQSYFFKLLEKQYLSQKESKK